jgi:hypothetical protein
MENISRVRKIGTEVHQYRIADKQNRGIFPLPIVLQQTENATGALAMCDRTSNGAGILKVEESRAVVDTRREMFVSLKTAVSCMHFS